MTKRGSKPGTALNALKILELFPSRVLGSAESLEDVKAAVEIMDAGRRAAAARQEKAAERGRTRLGAAGGGGGQGSTHARARTHFTPQHWLLCHMGLY